MVNAVLPAYVAAFNQYVRTELRYETDLTCKVLLTKDDKFTWNWNHAIPGGPPPGEDPIATNAMPDLAYAMKLNSCDEGRANGRLLRPSHAIL
jgi:hypothetical protein